MLGRADIRGMHTRTVLRRMYRIKWHRRITNPLDVVIRSVPPDMTSDAAARYHRSNQHGR